MKVFHNALTAMERELVASELKLRFKAPEQFMTPEALVIYEHGLMDNETLFEAVKEEYFNQGFSRPIEMPKRTYLTSEIIEHFRDKDCIPLSYDSINNIIHIAVLPEFEKLAVEAWKGLEIKKHYVPLFYYVENYKDLYDEPLFLSEIPEEHLFNYIVYEAIELGANAINFSTHNNNSLGYIYYNVKKARVKTRKRVKREQIERISAFLQQESGLASEYKHKKTIYFSIDLNLHYRGRIAMTSTYAGDLITINILKNNMIAEGLESLNLSQSTQSFLLDKYTSEECGLRLMVGHAGSGKSTTVLTALYEKLKNTSMKAISLEMPLKYPMEYINQISCLNEEAFKIAISTLMLQNPDIVYISEILNNTAKEAIGIANAGKSVYAAVNAASIADAVLRIQDITGLPLERIVMSIQSAIFQELSVSEGQLKPINRCVYFSEDFKTSLLGLSYGDIVSAIRGEEDKWA